MATRKKNWAAAKIIGGLVLLVVAVVGLVYGAILREMERAELDYSQGNAESALQRYETVEQQLRSYGVIRFMPRQDRQNLLLNQARLLYALKRYDEAAERLERENELSGMTTDGRFFLLRGNIAFRKAASDYTESQQKDARVLEDALRGAEDNLRDSLRLTPQSWDAKYNYEFINYVRRMMNQNDDQNKVKILMENVRVKETQPQALPPDQAS